MAEPQTQLDKFKQAARDLETDDDPERFAERVRWLIQGADEPQTRRKQKPVEKPK